MDRIVELVRQLEPETAPPPADVRARQRAALLGSVVSVDERPAHPRRRRPPHRGWFVAIAGAAAAAVAGALLVAGSHSPSRTSSKPPAVAPGTSAVLTAVTRALAGTGHDVEEVQSTVPGSPLATTAWVDLASGACRTDVSLNGQRISTLFDENGSAVSIDYGKRQWWTEGSRGVTCAPLTPQAIEQGMATGRYTVAGHTTLDGQPAIELVSTATSTGPHPVAMTTTLWVNATTYLPIQSTSTEHLTEHTVFTWLPATAANTSVLEVTEPPGFQQVAAPPPQVRPDR